MGLVERGWELSSKTTLDGSGGNIGDLTTKVSLSSYVVVVVVVVVDSSLIVVVGELHGFAMVRARGRLL